MKGNLLNRNDKFCRSDIKLPFEGLAESEYVGKITMRRNGRHRHITANDQFFCEIQSFAKQILIGRNTKSLFKGAEEMKLRHRTIGSDLVYFCNIEEFFVDIMFRDL